MHIIYHVVCHTSMERLVPGLRVCVGECLDCSIMKLYHFLKSTEIPSVCPWPPDHMDGDDPSSI